MVANRWNLDLVEDYYDRWLADPASVEESWRVFFEGYSLGADASARNGAAGDSATAPRRRRSRGSSMLIANMAIIWRTSTLSSSARGARATNS